MRGGGGGGGGDDRGEPEQSLDIGHPLILMPPCPICKVSTWMQHFCTCQWDDVDSSILSDMGKDDLYLDDRVKSGIFGQTAKFRQRPCLFHISNIEVRCRLIWIYTVCKCVSEFT